MSARQKIDDMELGKQLNKQFGDVFENIEVKTVKKEPERWWEVWTEGYRVSGNSNEAQFHGMFGGISFEDAVQKYIGTLDAHYQKLFDARRLSYWGCRFFDNETEARKAFG